MPISLRRPLAGLCIFLSLLLGGCISLGPDYQAPAVDAEPAWLFREKHWAGAEQAAPKGCAIKGNVTAHGHIYHMPWSPWYGKVKVDAAKGERWFCSESEAMAAGWRPAAVH